MNKREALEEARKLQEFVSFAERDKDSRGTVEYVIADVYPTKGGNAGAKILGRGTSWEDALADMRARMGL